MASKSITSTSVKLGLIADGSQWFTAGVGEIFFPLTHWGWVIHICVSKVTIIVSDNGLSPGRRQAIIWNNAGILLTGPLGTNFTGILIEIHTFSFKKMHLNMSSGKWPPFCLSLNVFLTSKQTNKVYALYHSAFVLNEHSAWKIMWVIFLHSYEGYEYIVAKWCHKLS